MSDMAGISGNAGPGYRRKLRSYQSFRPESARIARLRLALLASARKLAAAGGPAAAGGSPIQAPGRRVRVGLGAGDRETALRALGQAQRALIGLRLGQGQLSALQLHARLDRL